MAQKFAVRSYFYAAAERKVMPSVSRINANDSKQL
jgi:hypothetical protein